MKRDTYLRRTTTAPTITKYEKDAQKGTVRGEYLRVPWNAGGNHVHDPWFRDGISIRAKPDLQYEEKKMKTRYRSS
jgi:hypothetical protein